MVIAPPTSIGSIGFVGFLLETSTNQKKWDLKRKESD
jgi:hypothetical protein